MYDTIPIDDDLTERDREQVRTLWTTDDGTDPDVTVVVATYRTERSELTATLDALDRQTATEFETIVLDNGSDWTLGSYLPRVDSVSRYVEFDRNYGVNAARNFGAKLAEGDLLVFLDDDAVPDEDFVAAHREIHRTRDIVGARGRVEPKSDSIYNALAGWYDLGDRTIPAPLDTEGNASVDRDAFLTVGGFNEAVWGHEGADLTHRLIDRTGRKSVVYHPDAVIYHDFVTDVRSLVRKKARHRRYRRQLEENRPELFALADRYPDLPPNTGGDRSLPSKVVLFALNKSTTLLASGLVAIDGGRETASSSD